jgi:exopolyphosphatase/guanosine-5'-triphosphate,3'-diphosphate pyrophosphatase
MIRVAAIDCGTNSVRLLVADLAEPDSAGANSHGPDGVGPDSAGPGGALVDLVRRMEIVRLGQGVDRTGRLAPEAIERTRVALVDYAAQIEALGAQRVRMVATSATRDAANADQFRAMVVDTLGIAPEVVTGQEEAWLSFTGAVRGLPVDTPRPYLVVDIGGGSTEFVLGDVEPRDAISVDIGCVRMTERHLRDDPPTAEQIRAAEADITAVVNGALAVVPGQTARTLVGLAGSVTTVTALALGLDSYRPERIHHARVSYLEVARVTGELLEMTHDQRLALPVMHPGRADVIGAGALILRIVMERAGADSVVASEHDILDGICYSVASPT